MKILNDMTCVCLHSALMEFLPKGRSVCWKHNTHGLSGMQLFSSLDLFVVGVTLMRSVCRLHSSDSTKSVEFLSARMGIRSGCNLWNTKWICDSLHICVFVCDGGRRQSDRDLLYWFIMVLFVSCPLAWHYFILFHITHRLLSQQSWELYLFVLNLTQKCRVRRLCFYHYKARSRKWWDWWQERLLPFQTVWMCWCGTCPLENPCLTVLCSLSSSSHTVQSSYGEHFLLPNSQHGQVRIWSDYRTSYCNPAGKQRTEVGILRGWFSGQEALLKNKATRRWKGGKRSYIMSDLF